MQMRRWSVAVACGAAIGLAVPPGVASAQIREEPSRLPYYARSIEGSGEWSPIIFYRPVECVPEAFNLEAFFDVPGAFRCCGPSIPVTGTASFFTETLRPEGGARTALVVVNASGALDDGRSFSLHVTSNYASDTRRVRVTFGR